MLPQFSFLSLLSKTLFFAKRTPFVLAIGALLCGGMIAWAMPPSSLWICAFFGFSGYYALYALTKTPLAAFGLGFSFGFGYFVTGLWWIGNALLVEGSEFRWVWPLSVIGLPTLLSLLVAVFVGLARLLSRPRSLTGYATFCLMLGVSEWVRTHAFSGFPWNLYGYVWADSLPMAQISYLIGAHGLTFLTVCWASFAGFAFLPAEEHKRKSILNRQKMIAFLIVVSTLLLSFGYGTHRLVINPTAYNMDVGLVVVQPNIPQTMKWDPEKIQNNFLKTLSLSRTGIFGGTQPKTLVLLWPETAMSPSIYNRHENITALSDLLSSYRPDTYLITGILRPASQNTEGKNASHSAPWANSILVMDKSLLALSAYNKTHLVPFGEFIPFQRFIPLKPVTAFEGFERGNGSVTLSNTGTIPPFSPLICYEVIFPDEAIDPLSEIKPKWIVNVTNDGWYGNSAGPHQHFAQARMRAIETGLPLIRAANTGISGIFDPYGRAIDRGEIGQEAVLLSRLPLAVPPAPNATPLFAWFQHNPKVKQLFFPFTFLVWFSFLSIVYASRKDGPFSE